MLEEFIQVMQEVDKWSMSPEQMEFCKGAILLFIATLPINAMMPKWFHKLELLLLLVVLVLGFISSLVLLAYRVLQMVGY